MISMPVIEKPFQRIAMDIVGPLPKTSRGNRYILVICDYATRYPEAVALPTMVAPRVVKELIQLFARVGIPEEILTDQGTNFMSTLLEELYHLLQIRRIRTSPYHPQTDGLVERFNGTLKSMLRKFVGNNQKDWDSYLPYVLFAYREVPQESTGFSPFELLYGRRVRGPLDVLRECWTGEEQNRETVEQLLDVQERMREVTGLVRENLQKAQQRQKRHYDRGAQEQKIAVGDEVLVLLPHPQNRLKLEWMGPFEVTKQVGDVDYEVATHGRRNARKIYHVNLMKKWHRPAETEAATAFLALTKVGAGGQSESDHVQDVEVADGLDLLGESEEETPSNVSTLTEDQHEELERILQEFPKLFSEKPGRTSMVTHSIYLEEAVPIRQRAYRVPYSQRDLVQKEIAGMLADGVIRPSKSPWASPIVLVPKKDGGVRLCVDYRKLNQLAKFDAYPMPRTEEVLDRIGPATVITTLDLVKGYWQIPLAPESKEMTAFTTPFGLFEFEVMPFGLHNAPATFQRLMNYILQGCEGFAGAYLDDVIIYSRSWDEHLDHLREVFQRLQEAGLTLKVAKCQFAKEVHYLGHVVGGEVVNPDPSKIHCVREHSRPKTKKDVKSFLGLAGYYRRFVPKYSTIAAPLSDLTRKGKPEQILWSQECEAAFMALKELLVSAPVLQIVDPNNTLQTDASGRGLGAVLSQIGADGEEHPIAYASRKLLPREENYAVIEKECLAIVWALQVFHTYLFGATFEVQTDHQPLSWLHRMKANNAQLTRWALFLQPYCFRLTYRKGAMNGNADALSRTPDDTGERKNPHHYHEGERRCGGAHC